VILATTVGSKIRNKLSVTKIAMRNYDMVSQGTKNMELKESKRLIFQIILLKL